MSWWSRLFKKKPYVFKDEDRLRSKEVRLERDIVQDRIEHLERRRDRLRAEYKARELETEIEEMEDDLNGPDDDDGDDSPDSMLESLLMKVAPLLTAGTVAAAAPAPQTEKLHLTDEQLKSYKEQIPKQMLKKLQQMSDEELLALGKQYRPDIFTITDDDTIARALAILKS